MKASQYFFIAIGVLLTAGYLYNSKKKGTGLFANSNKKPKEEITDIPNTEQANAELVSDGTAEQSQGFVPKVGHQTSYETARNGKKRHVGTNYIPSTAQQYKRM